LLDKKKALVLFSGGSDSTYCAAHLAEQCSEIHLLTYDRISFVGSKANTEKNYDRLCRIYGRHIFVRKVVSIEKLHQRICFENYLQIALKAKLAVTALTFSKLAMHWFSCLYCVKNGIEIVADGAVPYMNIYPDQNKIIALDQLREFYAAFRIDYQNPAYEVWDTIEERLFDKGITDQPEIRGTAKDTQVTYAEQVIFAFFLKYYVKRYGMTQYEKIMADLYADRLRLISRDIRSQSGI
jgi:hypothetical protein